MEVLTIDSLDGVRRPRRGLAGAASDLDVVVAQQVALDQFESMAERGLVAQEVVDSVRNRVEELGLRFEALLNAGGWDPEVGTSNEVLERAAAAMPTEWAAYLRDAQALNTQVAAIVRRESTFAIARSVAAFTLGAAVGAFIVHRLT